MIIGHIGDRLFGVGLISHLEYSLNILYIIYYIGQTVVRSNFCVPSRYMSLHSNYRYNIV